MSKLTYTMENYLEAIYELSKDGKGARVSDIAKKLSVSKASTNSAMQSLAEKGLITNERYREIYLTKEGFKFAEFTSRKHQIIKKFLMDILKVDIDIADTDACAMEHVISNKTVQAMYKFLTDN